MPSIAPIPSVSIPPARDAGPGRAGRVELTPGQSIAVIVESVNGGKARIRIEGQSFIAETRVPLAEGARMMMVVEAVEPQIVLRIAGSLGAGKALATASPEALEALPREVVQALAEAQALLRQSDWAGAGPDEKAALLERIADLFARVGQSSPEALEEVRRAFLASNQPVETILARIVGRDDAAQLVRLPNDVKIALAGLLELVLPESPASPPSASSGPAPGAILLAILRSQTDAQGPAPKLADAVHLFSVAQPVGASGAGAPPGTANAAAPGATAQAMAPGVAQSALSATGFLAVSANGSLAGTSAGLEPAALLGDPMAPLLASIPPESVAALTAKPGAGVGNLIDALLRAPRSAAAAAMRAELSFLGEAAPEARQWLEKSVASLERPLVEMRAAGAPSEGGLSVQSQTDLFVAMTALARSGGAPGAPLAALIKAIYAPLADAKGEPPAPEALVLRAGQIQQAWQELAGDPSPIVRMAAQRTLAAIERAVAALRQTLQDAPQAAPQSSPQSSPQPRASAIPGVPGFPPQGQSQGVSEPQWAAWLPILLESRLAAAPWAVAARLPAGWAEVLFGVLSRAAGFPPSAVGAPLGAPMAPLAERGAAFSAGTIIPETLARNALAVIEQMSLAPPTATLAAGRLPVPTRRALDSLARSLNEWEGDLLGRVERQEVEVRATLERLAGRVAGLNDLIDSQRLGSLRAFDAGQPATFWLPLFMDNQYMYARIDYAAQFGAKRARHRAGNYNLILSLELTHAGAVQFRCHVQFRRVSLEVASADRRLLDIAAGMSEGLRVLLEARGFALERFAVSESLARMEDAVGLGAAGFRPVSLEA